MLLLLLCLCGCRGEQANTETRFLLDTVVTLTADCGDEGIDGAFALCARYEQLFSRTVPDSDTARLNAAAEPIPVSDEMQELLRRALYYSELSGGKFDVTICSVSELWDFENQVVPGRDEIAAALRNVDYHSIALTEETAFLNGKKIDLGGIAKGYIADRLTEYLKENGARSGILNLGGNVAVFGKEATVGIRRPFGEDTVAVIRLCDCSAVTAGIDRRSFERDGKRYHHILDPATGYGVENELASVTVFSKHSVDGDALSTVCMLLGTEKGLELINSTKDTEAVFLDRQGNMTLSSGLTRSGNELFIAKTQPF